MRSFEAAHNAYRLVIEPHVDIAIWAIIVAIGCVLVMVIDEMLKTRNAAAAGNRAQTKKSRRRR